MMTIEHDLLANTVAGLESMLAGDLVVNHGTQDYYGQYILKPMLDIETETGAWIASNHERDRLVAQSRANGACEHI
jgi:hypothetical protein